MRKSVFGHPVDCPVDRTVSIVSEAAGVQSSTSTIPADLWWAGARIVVSADTAQTLHAPAVLSALWERCDELRHQLILNQHLPLGLSDPAGKSMLQLCELSVAAAAHSRIPSETQCALAAEAGAYETATGDDLLAQRVCETLAQNPTVTPDAVVALLETQRPWIPNLLAGNENVDTGPLIAAFPADADIAAAVANRTHISSHELAHAKTFVDGTRPGLRSLLWKHLDAAEFDAALAGFSQRDSNAWLALSRHCPVDLLIKFAQLDGVDDGVVCWTAEHAAITSEVTSTLVAHRSVAVRSTLAWNPAVDEAAQLVLAEDSSPAVRASLARNESTCGEALQVLVASNDVEVLLAVAERADLTDADVTSLLGSEHLEVRRAIVANPSVDIDRSKLPFEEAIATIACPLTEELNAEQLTLLLVNFKTDEEVGSGVVAGAPLDELISQLDRRAAD